MKKTIIIVLAIAFAPFIIIDIGWLLSFGNFSLKWIYNTGGFWDGLIMYYIITIPMFLMITETKNHKP